MLREQVADYLSTSGISKSLFCRRLGISTQHLYHYLKGGEISDDLEERIRTYLDKYDVACR